MIAISSTYSIAREAAEQAHAVDAATRPQDPSFFEGQYQPKDYSDLSMAAQLMGKAFGRHQTVRSTLHYSKLASIRV